MKVYDKRDLLLQALIKLVLLLAESVLWDVVTNGSTKENIAITEALNELRALYEGWEPREH